jgi:hypothetical protein
MLINLTYVVNSEENFIECPSRSAAEKLIEGLDEKGLKEWQDGAKAGIDTRDWARLALHRTFWIESRIWRSGVIHLFTAILRKSAEQPWTQEFMGHERKCELFLLLC